MAQRAGLDAGFFTGVRLDELRHPPVRIGVSKPGQRRQRFYLTQRLQPGTHRVSMLAGPARERADDVKVPQPRQLQRSVEHRRIADFRELERASQASQSGTCGVVTGLEGASKPAKEWR